MIIFGKVVATCWIITIMFMSVLKIFFDGEMEKMEDDCGTFCTAIFGIIALIAVFIASFGGAVWLFWLIWKVL